ncbi:MAG: hypothetical protein IKM08_00080 [Clostridia bacterium]|nr:hypothetical protein [Clostridia bacterium]
MMKRITRPFCVLLLLLLLVSTCGCGINAELMASADADNTVAIAGDLEIPYENYYFLAMNQMADMKAVYGEDVFNDPQRVEELKSFVAENLFGYTEAMILVGRDYGLSLDSDEAQEMVQNEVDKMMVNQLENSRDAYIEMLNSRYMTDHYFRTYLGVTEYLVDAILLKMRTGGELDDSDDAAYRAVMGEDFTHVYQVFIDPQYLLGDSELAKSKANGLREQVISKTAGKERMDAMRVAIQSSHAIDDGNGLYIAKGEMEQQYDDIAFSLEEYGVSEVFYLNGGYCFLMNAPKDDSYVKANLTTLKQKNFYVKLNQKAEAYMDSLTLEWTEFGEELDILDLPELEADGGEWVKTLIGVLILAAIVGVIAAMVIFIPYKDDKKKKKKKKKSSAKAPEKQKNKKGKEEKPAPEKGA